MVDKQQVGHQALDASAHCLKRVSHSLLKKSDFPAYAMLSGWSRKGRKACPTCNHGTCSQYLKHSRKMCYMGHRAFLPPYHSFRRDKKSFDGKESFGQSIVHLPVATIKIT
ncbi:hypothetical protein KY290_026644 [Solanum tuberosum]|uniref:Uncharacterized protein n=1 Tax=Solanum tuberosum TaxID=4113 RepID=A0ABQ7UX11_SOLTU|nr:hypothetical protein KY290_026644 [Solanum tuberosum]